MVSRQDNVSDFFAGLFGQPSSISVAGPPVGVADSCLRSTVAALKTGGEERSHIADMLDDATLALAVAEGGERKCDASLAVLARHVPAVRDGIGKVRTELADAIRHTGWRLAQLQVVAADPGEAKPTRRLRRGEIVEVLASAIAQLKAYEVAAFCDRLGLPPHPEPNADPYRSKAVYTRARLASVEAAELVSTARQVLDELDDPALQEMVDRYRPVSRDGVVKNLIFGSTSKPDLVLTDALSNEVALVNVEEALIYDDGIPDEGLSWERLVCALLPREAAENKIAAARQLYRRLLSCLGSEPERLFFAAYAQTQYGRFGLDQPALVPQVWLHYDPRSRRQRGDAPVLTRQRMDFLLLGPGGRRVVCEIDGRTHYTDDAGAPSPLRYAEMVREDRELRLRGYEVFRFGAAELADEAAAVAVVEEFVARLFER